MAEKQKTKKNNMVRVVCKDSAQPVWANSTKDSYRCTKCGQTGHPKV